MTFRFTTEYTRIDRAPMRDLPEAAQSERFFRAGEFTNLYVDACSWGVLDALGALPGPAPRNTVDMAAAAGVKPERSEEFLWLLRKLAHSGIVVLDGAGGVRSGAVAAGDPGILRAAVLAEDPAMASDFDIIDAAAEGWPAFLRGERDGNQVLFTPKTLALWERHFSNDNPLYAAANLIAACAAGRAALGDDLQVLEAGGGLGSGAEALAAALGADGSGGRGRIGRYLFTDISPYFVRRSEPRLRERFPGVPFEFRPLDLNRGLEAQGVPRASFDIAYAVNTVHVVKDLGACLAELRESLRPGGVLILGEAVRPSPGHVLGIEFIFQLLREFREVLKDPEARPHGGFLEWPHWKRSLERAGFEDVRSVPELEPAVRAYPEHFVAALTARSPGGAGTAGVLWKAAAASCTAASKDSASLGRLIDCLPQKPPFLFVHGLSEVKAGVSAAGSVTFPTGHPVFENHLPGNPIVPGVILIEALAQLSGIVLIPSDRPEPIQGYLGEVRRVRFRRKVRPMERVELSTRLLQRYAGAASFAVEARVDGQVAVEGEIAVGGGSVVSSGPSPE